MLEVHLEEAEDPNSLSHRYLILKSIGDDRIVGDSLEFDALPTRG